MIDNSIPAEASKAHAAAILERRYALLQAAAALAASDQHDRSARILGGEACASTRSELIREYVDAAESILAEIERREKER